MLNCTNYIFHLVRIQNTSSQESRFFIAFEFVLDVMKLSDIMKIKSWFLVPGTNESPD